MAKNFRGATFLPHPVDQVCSRFLISQSVPKIFAVKVESCPKSGRIFDILTLQHFWGAGPQNLYLSDHAHLMASHVAKFQSFRLFQKLRAQTCQILSQFYPIKNCKGDPQSWWGIR